MQKFDAKNASTDSTNLYFIHYIKSQDFVEMKAAVLSVMEYMMEVILIDTGHLLKIRYSVRKFHLIYFTANNIILNEIYHLKYKIMHF